MNDEVERYYCRTCNKLYSDVIHDDYYTYNNFIDNQARVTLGVPYNNTTTTPNYHSQCPHCYSICTVKVVDVLTLRKHGGDRRSGLFSIYNDVKKALESKPLNSINDK